MSLKRRLLRQGGVDRKVKRLVLTFTTSTYTLQKGADGKPKQDAHINLDAPGWTSVEVLAVLRRAVADVEQKVQVESDARRCEGQRMLDGTNVMAPGAIGRANRLLQEGVNDGAATLPGVRPADTAGAVEGAAGH